MRGESESEGKDDARSSTLRYKTGNAEWGELEVVPVRGDMQGLLVERLGPGWFQSLALQVV